jgi:hypothetical protein
VLDLGLDGMINIKMDLKYISMSSAMEGGYKAIRNICRIVV